MRVLIDSVDQTDRVSVVDVDDLRRLHVETGLTDPNRIAAALEAGGAGRLDGDAVWLDIEYLRTSADPSDPAPWADSFYKMIDFARTHGWLSADSKQVRAHIVTTSQEK
jgi:hypothetical protein